MVVLVDTVVWIRHLRQENQELISLLNQERVLTHSSVIGELACGHIPGRKRFIEELFLLPKATEAEPDEVLGLIERKFLFGKGLGWVDIQLIASAAISNASLFSYDKILAACAKEILGS